MSSTTIRDLHQQIKRAQHGWRERPNGYQSIQDAARAYTEAGETLRQALPVLTSTAYAYSPRENTGSGGEEHIVVKEALTAGRLHREAGDALCKPAARFWGLSEINGRHATCLKCLEIAEKLAR